MRILVASHGTRGDVQPIVALGVALKARGHVVQLVAPANFVTWIRSYGLDIQSDGIDVEAALRSSGTGLQSLSWQMRYLSHTTPLLFEPVARASEGCELIVCAGIQFAAVQDELASLIVECEIPRRRRSAAFQTDGAASIELK